MGLGEWVIAFFGCLLIGLFVFIIVKESRNYREIKAEDVQAIKSDKNIHKNHGKSDKYLLISKIFSTFAKK